MLQCFYCICIVNLLRKINISNGTIKFLWSDFELTLCTWSLICSQRPVLHFPPTFTLINTHSWQIKHRLSLSDVWYSIWVKILNTLSYNCVTLLRTKSEIRKKFMVSPLVLKRTLIKHLVKQMFVSLNNTDHGPFFFHCCRSGDVVVQVIQEYGHQQHMGPPPAQETIRGKLVWQFCSVTQARTVHKNVFNETQSLFGHYKLTVLLHFTAVCYLLWLCWIVRNGQIPTCFLVVGFAEHWHDLQLLWSSG